MGFDVLGAKEAGFTDLEIANALGAEANFDVAGARQAGFDDANIIQTITTGVPFRSVSPVAAVTEGMSRGIVDLVSTVGGAPVDIATSLVESAVNLPSEVIGGVKRIAGRLTGDITGPQPLVQGGFEIDQPFLGSQSIREGLSTGFETIGTPIQTLESLPPQQRPLGIAGEVIGSSAIPAAAPFAVAKGGGGLFKPIVDLATKSPKAFLASEVASVSGAAGGGALAEFVDPGDPVTRVISEIAGGVISPAALVARGGRGTTDSVKKLISSYTSSGREQRAANIVQDLISEAGESTDDIVRLLAKADVEGVKLTSAQKTGSPALLALEAKLAQKSSRFANEAEDLATNSLKTLRELTDDLTKSGDPAAIRTAAKLRQRYFDDLLSRRLEDAGQDALEARAAIGTETTADLANISKNTRNILKSALTDARAIETTLWERIPKETPLGTNSLLKSVDEATSKYLLESENLPTVVQNEISRLIDKGATAGDMLKFRSRLLKLSRGAASKGDFNDKAVFDTISDGILQDLDGIPGTFADEARAFSRTLHEKFTNTFAGEALSKGKTGERIAPEVLLERAFGSGGTKGEVAFKQIEEAGNFPNEIFGRPLLDQQERFLRVAAQNTVDNTGRVNPNKLQNFLKKNEATLNRFPELKSSLSDAVTSEQTFRSLEKSVKSATKAIQQRTAFANLIKTDDPVVAVGNVLTGKNTRREYSQLSKLARRSGEGSVEGLKSATLKNVYDKSINTSGQFSFKKYKEILTKGLSKEDQGVLSLMRQNGVIDKGAADRLKSLTRRAIEIEDALSNTRKLDELLGNPDALFDLVTRIVGAKIGTSGPARGMGTSLIAAQAGSRFARNFAQKIPNAKINEVLELAAKDPKFLAVLLKKTKTFSLRSAIERQVNAFLISAGLQLDEESDERLVDLVIGATKITPAYQMFNFAQRSAQERQAGLQLDEENK